MTKDMEFDNLNELYDNEISNIITSNLKFLREHHNLTKEKIAQVIGVTRSAYSFYEDGKRDIRISTLKKLAFYYNVSLDMLTAIDMNSDINSGTSFVTLKYDEYNDLVYQKELSIINNKNLSLLMVKESDTYTKIYESTSSFTLNKDHLFEFKNKIHTGKINMFDDNSGYFINSHGKSIRLSAKDMQRLVVLGVLISEINTSVKKDNFF